MLIIVALLWFLLSFFTLVFVRSVIDRFPEDIEGVPGAALVVIVALELLAPVLAFVAGALYAN